MRLIPSSDVFNNINTQHGIPDTVQKKLMNGNVQFIIMLAQKLKINSYSLTALACYFCHYFFIKRCYMNYDRFLIATACVLLACKLKDANYQMRVLVPNYHALLCQLENRTQLLNETLSTQIKDKICMAESRVLKTIEFDFEVRLASDYTDVIVKKYTEAEQGHAEATFYCMKVLLLDFYRTYCCLCFDPLNIAIAAYLMACSSQNYQPFLNPRAVEYIKKNVQCEEVTFKDFLASLQREHEEAKCSADEIYECIFVFNELLFLNMTQAQYEDTKKK